MSFPGKHSDDNPIHNKDLEIYVGNLPVNIKKETLEEAFIDFNVTSVYLVVGKEKRFAFLKLDCEESIRRAVQEMHNYKLGDRTICIRAGSRELQTKIDQDRNSNRGEPRGTPITASVVPKQEYEIGRPVLEPVKRSRNPSEEEDDLPPPLELAFEMETIHTKNVYNADDRPPTLKNTFISEPAKRFPIVDCFPITLVVANFPFGTTEDELQSMFQDFFPLKVTVVLNSKVYNELTYAYVTVPTQEQAEAAIMELDNTLFRDRHLLITYILERIPSG